MSWDHQVWWVHIFSITNTHNDIFMDIHIFYPSSVLLMWSSCKFWSSLYLHVSELYFLITWTPYTSIHGLTLVSVNDWSHCKCSLKVVPLPTTLEVMLLVCVFISYVHHMYINHVIGCWQCTPQFWLQLLLRICSLLLSLQIQISTGNSWHLLLVWIKISSVVFFYLYWDAMGMMTVLYFKPVKVPAYKCLIWGLFISHI